MERKGPVVLAALLLFSSVVFGQDVYRWVDEKGTIHFTDDLGQVPEKYRNQIPRRVPSQEPQITPPVSPQPTGQPPGTMGEREVTSAPDLEERDAFGRGEDWWRAKVREWNEKLKTAQKGQETTYNDWKTKEEELEASKFKPDSFKRKLKAEIKSLKEKTKEWEKQVDEAKDMLERVLPKEAKDSRANPEWLKMEK